MRPLLLQMTAFGPFPEQEQIDFQLLGENPLFLINGPTGSGKTTILDAICFALYGKTTGDEREGGQMRSDLAAAELLTEVALEFELHGRTFRIRRVPEQLRPKSRGEGFTEQKPEAQLCELQADGSEKLLVSSKVRDATQEIENLTGLSVDQFRQVMVLPQGKFRQLLMAESAEREKIFGQLFQTRIYKRLEESLKAQSAEIRRERERQLQLQQGILEGAELESRAALETERQNLQPEVVAAERQKQALEGRYLQASEALQQARNLTEEFKRLESLAGQLAELKQQQGQVDQDRLRLTAAEQALKLQPLFVERTRCENELQQLQDAERLAQTRLQDAEKQRQRSEAGLNAAEELLPGIDQLKGRQVELASYRERSARLSDAQAQLHTARQNLQAAEAEQQRCSEQLNQVVSQLQAFERQQQSLQQRQTKLAEQQLRLKQLAEQLGLKNELKGLTQQQTQLRQELTSAEQKGKQLREQAEQQDRQVKQLELDWHQGQAAILASELQAGQPCPVCGSMEHPAPAQSEKPLPSQLQLEQARTGLQGVHQRLADARESYAAVREKLSHCEEQIANAQAQFAGQADLSSAELEASHRQLESDVATLLAEGGQLNSIAAELQQMKRQEVEARQQLEQSSGKKTAQTAELATATSVLQTAEQELPEKFRQPGTLERALKDGDADIGRLEAEITGARQQHKQDCGNWEAANAGAQAAKQSAEKAERLLKDARQAAAEAIADSDFEDEQAYQQSLLDAATLETLRADIASYDASCQRLNGALEQQQTSLRGKELPDPQQLEAALQEAEERKRSCEANWQQLAGRLKVLESTRSKLQDAAAQQTELDKQYAVIGTLSDVANGQTGNKISLQRFVLSVLLDDVLIEASRRLSLMSKGRYQLLRKEERSKGNKASGLELEVEDAYTGKVRPVATLSGGESFMAALALALGLSDVAQAYAGGIRLDTLFIDEGFGSLDSESLDLAVRTLVDLQAAGRMVGVISHVAELKEQMPLRIDLQVEQKGSRVALVAS